MSNQADLKPVTFTFGGDDKFQGFSDGTTWNGFDNVRVTPAEFDRIVEHFDDSDAFSDVAKDENGLYDLSSAYVTSII